MINDIKQLLLDSLSNGIPAIDHELAGMMRKSAMVCLNHHQHKSGVQLAIEFELVTICTLHWTGEVTEEMLRQYAGTSSQLTNYQPTTRTIDDAACAIGLLFIRETTEYTAFTKAAIGTKVDYYLTSQDNDSDLIFNEAKARLEISGILTTTPKNTPDTRLKQKQNRLLKEDIPTFIIIVEFGQPYLLMRKIL